MVDNIKNYVLECALTGDMAPLIYQLENSTVPLTLDERKFLANYLRGEIKKIGRPKKSPRMRWEAFAVMDLILCLEAQGSTRDYAVLEAARICGISERSVRRRLDELLPGDEDDRRKELSLWNDAALIIADQYPDIAAELLKHEHILSGRAYREVRVSAIK